MRVRASSPFIWLLLTTSCGRTADPVLITSFRWRDGEVKVNDYSSGIEKNHRCAVEWHGPDRAVTVLARFEGQTTPGIELKGEELWISYALGPELSAGYRTLVFASPSQQISDRIEKGKEEK